MVHIPCRQVNQIPDIALNNDPVFNNHHYYHHCIKSSDQMGEIGTKDAVSNKFESS